MKKDNLILFPGLKKRLFQLGMERLEDRQFKEAANFLEQAKEIDDQDGEIDMALVVAYYENADYEQAKKSAEDMLHQGIGDYHEVNDLYIMILMQLGLHDQVVHTLETLFEERHVPPDKREHYESLLKFSKRAVHNNSHEAESIHGSADNLLLSLEDGDFREQLLTITALADKNIQPYKDSLLSLLKDSQVHPIIQTATLNVLKEHQIETKIEVKKFDYEGEFIPAELPDVKDMPLCREVISALNAILENDNPVLLEQLTDMILRHQFLLFPFEHHPENPVLWAAAYKGFGHEMYGENWSKENTAKRFKVDILELENAVSFIFDLEQSSPSIV